MRWLWVDRILELVPGQRLVAVKNVSLAEEHLHDHFAQDGGAGEEGRMAMPVMPASLILEGVAQSAGILVGHASGFKEKVVLAKIGRATIDRDAAPGTTLRYTATIERMDAGGAATNVTIDLLDHHLATDASGVVVESSWRRIGMVEMMFSHLDGNLAGPGVAGGVPLPEHNFVFGEQFQTLLRCSGVA